VGRDGDGVVVCALGFRSSRGLGLVEDPQLVVRELLALAAEAVVLEQADVLAQDAELVVPGLELSLLP
jgi:hypothetical protein